MKHDHRHEMSSEEFCKRMDALGEAMHKLEAGMARHTLGGEWLRMKFDGKAGQLRQLDDKGSNALALAIYNPNDFRIYVGLAGAGAAADSFLVPKQKLVVAPIQINGAVELAADASDLGEKNGFIWRVRFPTPQPFFVGALA